MICQKDKGYKKGKYGIEHMLIFNIEAMEIIKDSLRNFSVSSSVNFTLTLKAKTT